MHIYSDYFPITLLNATGTPALSIVWLNLEDEAEQCSCVGWSRGENLRVCGQNIITEEDQESGLEQNQSSDIRGKYKGIVKGARGQELRVPITGQVRVQNKLKQWGSRCRPRTT